MRWIQYLMIGCPMNNQQIGGIFGPVAKAATEEFSANSD
jgi:hypothetical protein